MITRKPFVTTAISIVIVAMATSSLLGPSVAASLTLADHLVPPPLPLAQRLKHARAPAPSAAANQPERQQPIPIHSGSGENSVPPGFMTRIARWFGFGASGEHQLTAGSHTHAKYSKSEASGKQAYVYPQPNQQQLSPASGGNVKAACINCNKYPWVPMLPPGIQYPVRQQYQQHQWIQQQQQQQILEAQASQQHPQKQQPNSLATSPHLQQQSLAKQRAVQFHFPLNNHLPPQKGGGNPYPSLQELAKLPLTPPQYPALPFVPIPVPNLSASALPPLYSAQPFRPFATATPTAHSEQQLPTTEAAHFTESVGAHSELQPDSVYPTQTPPTTDQDPSFEIVQSHQLTDFVSSVEYPTSFVQSQSYDVPSETLPRNHKAGTEEPNTVKYQHETLDPKLSGSHVPASQLLTEIGNFGSALYQQPEYSTLQMTHAAETTSSYPTQPQTQQFESHSQVLAASSPNELSYDLADNFPSASSKNFSALSNANSEQLLPKWTAETYSSIQTDEFYYSTPQPQSQSLPQTTTEIPTEKSLQVSGSEFNTERVQDTTVEFVPSLQTEFSEEPPTFSKKPQRERETPKRLLDAPIAHSQGSQRSPVPRTRDPSELSFRLGSNLEPHEFQHANHAYAGDLQQQTTSPWLVTPTPAHTVSSASPTPTSTYGALDASGQYAGMAPPPAPSATLPQLIAAPYATRNRPRPFQPTRTAGSAIPNLLHDNWSQANDVVEHVQQESKLVSSATKAPTNGPRTTKYLTRILASNLRELLKREQEQKNEMKPAEGFDFSKLQRTIDDWTEQEFTSLSHRPSTPTIAGRSKNIPPEYLTTTPATPRQAKTTSLFNVAELSSSINNLEPLLVGRGSKRFEYPPIDDNRIPDYFYDSTLARKKSTTTTTTTTPRPEYTTHPTTTTATPFYIRAISTSVPTELWQKARVSISPQTKERIYVVTPQPLYFPQRMVPISTDAPPESGVAAENGSNFKSPRFLVRPTPRNGPSTSTSTPSSLYAPEIFGLRILSAFIPSKPVEIIDGNSKVLTTVTSSDKVASEATDTRHRNAETHVQRIRSTSKPTMAPSPR